VKGREDPGEAPRGLLQRCRNAVKHVVLAAYVHLYGPIRNWVRGLQGRCHVTVIVYHRVSDAFRDSVTVGVDQFRQQVKMLKRHYDVLGMDDFLSQRGMPRRRPGVVLSFDDGYEDNYYAAKTLKEMDLPCTFFVSTRIVGSGEPFPHDVKRLGVRVPALNWNQVREMAADGFRFGSHSAHHANMAAIPIDEARQEIEGSRADLLREVGPTGAETWFAYPHGRRKDITEEVRRSLPAWAIRYCFSAHGGVNFPDFDPMDVRRQPVDHKFTHMALRAVVEGWKIRGA